MKTLDTKIDDLLFESALLATESLDTPSVTRNTGSPIEKLMLVALWSRSVWHGTAELADWASGTYSDAALSRHVRNMVMDDAGKMFSMVIMQQMHVDKYVADFGIAAATSDDRVLIVAVECDGHEFHEKTRKQAAKDKARDRAFAERDIRLFRFSGSEIWADAGFCADQVLGFVRQWQTAPLLHSAERASRRIAGEHQE